MARNMLKRILIDGFFLGKPYGFGRFIQELCRALGGVQSEFEFIVAVPARVDQALLDDYEHLRWHRLPDMNFVVWEQVMIPQLARRLLCDLIHFPYNTCSLLTHGIQSLVTVHDLLFLEETGSFRNIKELVSLKYSKTCFRNLTRNADIIVSVSETTRFSLQKIGVQSRTVYNTADGFIEKNMPNVREQAIRPYILHRGGYLEHRNTLRVINAFRGERQALAGFDLKIIGAPLGADKWLTQDDATIHYLPRLSDKELAALYASSACVVATSLREGFCLPIIEGFGFAAPVVTSDIDPMREIAGDAACLVDPRNTADIGRAIVSVVSDPALANSLVERGHLRLQAFSSARMADDMLNAYRS